jgi:hypothetical protein
MSTKVAYIRNRAEKLRAAASAVMDPDVRSDYTSGARYLELVADEIDAGMHES